MLSRIRRAAPAAAACLAAAAALGCASVESFTAEEEPVAAGTVRVAATLCPGAMTSGGTGAPWPATCTEGAALDTEGRQLFLAWNVPIGWTLVDTRATGGPEGAQLTPREDWFTRLPDPDDADPEAPYPDGTRKWVGVATGRLGATGSQRATVVARFTPDAGTIGTPSPVELHARTRLVDTDAEAAAPLTCDGADCFGPRAFGGTTPIATVTPAGLGVSAPDAAVRAARGTVATLPFRLASGGAKPVADLRPQATTTLPGATVAALPDVAFAGGPAEREVPIAVTVPAGAPLGDHDVTVRVALPGGVGSAWRPAG